MSRDDVRSESADVSEYNNTHRAFLQAFFARSVMTIDEIKPVLSAIMTTHDPDRPLLIGDITQPYITTFFQTLNARISPLDYEIRSTRSQTSKTLTYALINSTSDTLTQLATTFSHEEIAYIKRLLDYMFETNNTRNREIMALTSLETSRLAKAPRQQQSNRQSQFGGGGEDVDGTQTQSEPTTAPLKGISMSDSERIISTLISQKLFEKSRAGYYTLAPRALMELRSYLKETYNETPTANPEDDDDDDDDAEPPVIRIRDCEGCREIVTIGLRCKDKDCGIRFHDSCAAMFFGRMRGEARKCPGCRGEWTGDCFVGERAAVGAKGRTSAVNGAGAGVARSSMGARGGHGEEEDEEE